MGVRAALVSVYVYVNFSFVLHFFLVPLPSPPLLLLRPHRKRNKNEFLFTSKSTCAHFYYVFHFRLHALHAEHTLVHIYTVSVYIQHAMRQWEAEAEGEERTL